MLGEDKKLAQSNNSKTSQDPVALFPDVILETVTLAHPKEILLVKGRVERLSKPWPSDVPKWIFGNLVGQEASIGFRCPIDTSPTLVGEYVVLSGLLKSRKSKVHDGLELILEGELYGSWTPAETHTQPLIALNREYGRLSLSAFVRQHGLSSLLVLSTSTAESDLLTATSKYGVTTGWISASGNYSDKKKLLSDLNHALDIHDVKGVVFVRGGSDPATLRFWDDPSFVQELLALNIPFYTAIGHSDRLLLADKYSDEAFPTPTAFGEALGASVSTIQKESEIVETIEGLRLKAEAQAQLLVISSQRVRVLYVIVIILALVLAGILWRWLH